MTNPFLSASVFDRLGRVCFLVVLVFFSFGQSAPSIAREIVSLDGEWDFATDAVDGQPAQAGKISVPGIWNNQGFGPENDKIKFNYVGVGRYRRSVKAPACSPDQRVFLVLTGISRYATVRVNGKSVGDEAIGCVGSHEWDVTDALAPQKDGAAQPKDALIEIDVDSRQRWGRDPLLGAAQLNDYMLIVWGGIWGHAYLETRPKAFMKDLFITCDVRKSECAAQFDVVGNVEADAVRLEIFEFPMLPDARPVAVQTLPFVERRTLAARLQNPKLWSPDSPNLYWARVSILKDGRTLDSLETRFGMKELRFDGMKILLNGRQIFLTGYGDDHIYPVHFSMPCDKKMFLERLRLIKEFGFNHVRHHSAILPHEYYEACDEVGIMPNAEFLLGYPAQLPGWGSLWKNGNTEKLSPEIANDLLCERFEAVIREYRNHPSIFAWVFGNELNMGPPWTELPLRNRAFEIAKRLDPLRPFMDLDGDWRNQIEKEERDTCELYSVLFDEWANPVVTPGKFDLKELSKPAVAHEMGNYVTFSRPDQVELFETTAFKPFWMAKGREEMERLGLLDEAEEWARASERLYFCLHKAGIETLRKNPRISGYHWWLIQDYWTTSNGLFDLFFRQKSIAPEEVRMINAPVVLLQNGLERFYRSGESIRMEALCSNFSGAPLDGELTLTLELKGETIQRKFPVKNAPVGEVSHIADFSFTVPTLNAPEQLRVAVELAATDAKGVIQKNQWTAWLFPEKILPPVANAPIFADDAARRMFADWDLSPIPSANDSEAPLPADAVYLATFLTSQMVRAMEAGANVTLLGRLDFMPSVGVAFKQTWWKAGDSETENHCGTFVYPDPIVDDVTRDSWCDGAWCELLDGAVKFKTDSLPVPPQTVIRALPSLVRFQDSPILFRARIGKGVLTVSGLNHAKAAGTPLNDWIVRRMLEPIREKEAIPTWSADLVLPKISVPEGTSLGFLEVLAPGELADGPTSYAETAPYFVCRQNRLGNAVVWKTAPAANWKKTDVKSGNGGEYCENCEKETTFIFAGCLGYRSQPVTEGFELAINDVPILRFDLPDPDAPSAVWTSNDGKVVLRFVIDATVHGKQDMLGRYFLTLPNSMLTNADKAKTDEANAALPSNAFVAPGAVKLTVRSLGEGSRRWFALNPCRNFAESREGQSAP